MSTETIAGSDTPSSSSDVQPTEDVDMLQKRKELNRRIFACLIEGEKSRGNAGACLVYLVDGTVAYRLVHEIAHDEFREALEDLLSEEGDKHMFVVEENAQRQLHLWKVPRREVADYEFAITQRELIESQKLTELKMEAEMEVERENGESV